jgi:hypothetical protein
MSPVLLKTENGRKLLDLEAKRTTAFHLSLFKGSIKPGPCQSSWVERVSVEKLDQEEDGIDRGLTLPVRLVISRNRHDACWGLPSGQKKVRGRKSMRITPLGKISHDAMRSQMVQR